MAHQHGPYVRLWGIRPSQLPSETASANDLAPLLQSILNEAVPFVSTVPPQSSSSSSSSSSGKSNQGNGDGPWKAKGCRAFHHSAAPVHMFERVVSAEELKTIAKDENLPQASNGSKFKPETWSLRRSVHEEAKKAGTADWEEWVRCFKDGHADAEMKFTPTVMSHMLKKQWDCTGVEVTLGGDVYEDFTLKLEESVHKMPAPLNNRVFPVLQVTAAVRGRREFIVVQIAAVPESLSSEEPRSDGALRGTYTSIERFKEVDEQGNVEWLMGTVSDARGVLPAWIQKMAVPGQIAKDVDMFLDDPKDLSNADVLARMTIELNMRAVGNQAERLEKDLSTLMMRAKEDKSFRERHEARLQNIFREILAVKQRMGEIQGPEWSGNGKVDLEECKKGMDESAELFRKELGELKGMVSDISSTVDKLPTAEEAEALMRRTQASALATVGSEIQTRSKTRKPLSEPKTARSQVSIKQRIGDAIGSTRRWNRDHKTTKLSDAIFIANYLRQQSKRDPPMAVYIQRSILRHVNRSGGQKAQARPKNLEQFCQTLVWRDVIETAENVLVRNTARTAKALEERMSFS
ncbi:uncharacterized protein TRIVIDRAFT_57363 [Trichoderma virens Gv29-8]|uniref:DUF3074 domain-containing protein n=1 Tax=Hypocrea virens (strain Gv29-8 / FGSC 10586) TaxID=413071 RepID=G9N700_HYPVG|nr:uncharacterized protein TRIVIDRAFT_57363 [Trichoderma virens Gv29-8]EHK17498.1 hypothetical protein TRIVIDRAFT_57363 [Trichoderma virens Gv29-8]UKZ53780.1 hypothetical protein TrVGV298_007580 [Trichoderma virens]